ncbi:MAG: tryptophan synthase subunit alpha [Phaeodactylibacter sp.]|nr:tryptophan synthase subunit alpha [Phaeodactylibacter sp.]MCB9274265.1 tryptophan synthase subunit alpha [Lewinellaceae bacterium]
MNRIQQLFARQQRDILNIYFTAGYPGLDDTERIILALDKAGASLIELGMPYSDPLADGPTIQQSSQVALKNGMTLQLLFEQAKAARKRSEIPIVLMGYFNQVMQYGEQRFFNHCVEAGIDGLILPDLPLYEYERSYQSMISQAGLSISFLITPQTPEARIRKVDELSQGFVYMVADSSITGAKSGIADRQLAYFERVDKLGLKNPRLIGFGISNRETFELACRYASGAIIGSAFIKALSAAADVEQAALDFVRGIRGSARPV